MILVSFIPRIGLGVYALVLYILCPFLYLAYNICVSCKLTASGRLIRM